MRSSAKKSPDKRPKPPAQPAEMPLGALNYLFIAIGTAVIAFSYAGMYLEKAVDGFFSLTVAPVLLVLAYLGILFGIFFRPGGKRS